MTLMAVAAGPKAHFFALPSRTILHFGSISRSAGTPAAVTFVQPVQPQATLASKRGFTDNTNMAQSTRQLEARLERVEKELAEVKAALAGKQVKPWYEEIVGSFKNDEAFAEIIRLGGLIRQGKLKG